MRFRRILMGVVTAAAFYFAIFGGEYNFFELRQLERQQRREAAELTTLQQKLERMRLHADSLANEPAALERIARERYGMIREGERLYRFAQAPETQADTALTTH